MMQDLRMQRKFFGRRAVGSRKLDRTYDRFEFRCGLLDAGHSEQQSESIQHRERAKRAGDGAHQQQ